MIELHVGDMCPACGEGALGKEIGPEIFEYKGAKFLVDNYATWVCDKCGESFVDNNELGRSGKMLKAWKDVVDEKYKF